MIKLFEINEHKGFMSMNQRSNEGETLAMKKISDVQREAICVLSDNGFSLNKLIKVFKSTIGKTTINNIRQNHLKQFKTTAQIDEEKTVQNDLSNIENEALSEVQMNSSD